MSRGLQQKQPQTTSSMLLSGGDLNSQGETSRVLMLSLMLLLLAIFVALTSMTSFKVVKAEAVMNSVAQIFRLGDERFAISSQALTAREAGIFDNADPLSTLHDYFQTSFPVAKIDVIRQGDGLKVSLPLSEVFEGRDFKTSQMGLLDRMTNYMREDAQFDARLRIEAVSPVKDQEETLIATSNLLELLEKNSMPKQQLYLSLKSGNNSEIHFLFSRLRNNDP